MTDKELIAKARTCDRPKGYDREAEINTLDTLVEQLADRLEAVLTERDEALDWLLRHHRDHGDYMAANRVELVQLKLRAGLPINDA